MFPFETVRGGQAELLADVRETIKTGGRLLAHAPTGIGKTAATISPAVEAIGDRVLFFVTPKHSQHRMAIETLALLKKKFSAKISAVDVIGKKWMCRVNGATDLNSRDFYDYCKSVRMDETCPFYNATFRKGKPTTRSLELVRELTAAGPIHVEELIERSSTFCPYEIMGLLGREANAVVCDYYHVFQPGIRNSLLRRLNRKLEDAIVIVDEAQNLPGRLRELLSSNISDFALKRAVKELEHFDFDELAEEVETLQKKLGSMRKFEGYERQVSQEEFWEADDALLQQLKEASESIVAKQRKSVVGHLAEFLEGWSGEEGYIRLIRKKKWKETVYGSLEHHCLDPSLATNEVFEQAHAVVLMSGTLTPLKMYADVLGLPKAGLKQYVSPFPAVNRLNLVVPTVTTRFKERSDAEFEKIARVCSRVVSATPGTTAIFFPSYKLKETLAKLLYLGSRQILEEHAGLTKKEKADLLHKIHKLERGVFLGVLGGSFSEGVDFRENTLKTVVIVGLPLERPNIEVRSLIDYYDKKFGRGWDYGYIYPAVSRAIQASGRMIRSETDRGVAVFLDERYTWGNYRRCFPPELKVTITERPEDQVRLFWA